MHCKYIAKNLTYLLNELVNSESRYQHRHTKKTNQYGIHHKITCYIRFTRCIVVIRIKYDILSCHSYIYGTFKNNFIQELEELIKNITNVKMVIKKLEIKFD